jgi:pimeloyl-ACP methyl ester carboxylesterase
MISSKPKLFQSKDGLKIAYSEFGDLKGRPIFFFHGSPGSRLEALHMHEPALHHGYRIIAPDRPGMGESDYRCKRKWLDYPNDITELASHLDITKFGIIGVSGGGPPLFSCAYKIPENLNLAVGISVWAPNINGELYNHISPIDRSFSRFANISLIFRLIYAIMGLQVKIQSGRNLMMNFRSSMCDADLAIIENNDRLVKFLARDIKESFKQGSKGPALDAILQYRDWGFKISDINFPIHLYHGTADKFVPFVFSMELDRLLPDSTLKSYPNQGHYSMLSFFEKIFYDLDKYQIKRSL